MTARPRSSLLALFIQSTGKTSHIPGAMNPDTDREVAQRLGYWPDRTNRFKGW